MNQINIEIAYALPDRYYLKSFKVDEGTMIQTAILQSGILQQFTEIDLRENKVGIYSRPAKLTYQLKDGDRIEIYRPLSVSYTHLTLPTSLRVYLCLIVGFSDIKVK